MNAISIQEAQALATVPYMPRKPFPSWKTMEETLRQWHEQSLNDPEYLWISFNFEDMADVVSKAIFCASAPFDATPDNSGGEDFK